MEYMNCLEATDEGCQWFVTDPENEEMVMEIHERVTAHQRQQQTSAAAGREVQAKKYEVLAQRAEGVQEEVLRRTSQELRDRLRVRRQALEGDQT